MESFARRRGEREMENEFEGRETMMKRGNEGKGENATQGK